MPSYVAAFPDSSTATQNSADAQETVWNEPPWSTFSGFDQVPACSTTAYPLESTATHVAAAAHEMPVR